MQESMSLQNEPASGWDRAVVPLGPLGSSSSQHRRTPEIVLQKGHASFRITGDSALFDSARFACFLARARVGVRAFDPFETAWGCISSILVFCYSAAREASPVALHMLSMSSRRAEHTSRCVRYTRNVSSTPHTDSTACPAHATCVAFGFAQKENDVLTTYWSKSTLSPR